MKKSNKELKNLIEEVVKDNVPQGRAIKAIVTSREHLFITGKAGSGKSFFMRRIVDYIDDCAIVAPTGVAAVNAGGMTIHSFFRLPISPYIPSVKDGVLQKSFAKVSRDPLFVKRIKAIDTLIIDEISMVRADILDEISDLLQQIKKRNVPFGGVRLIMFGDVSQLPPIVSGSEGDIFTKYYESPYFFSSKAIRLSGFTTIIFEKSYRQTDSVFVNLLNNIRRGKINQEDEALLSSRYMQPPKDFNGIRICTHNSEVKAINESSIDRIDSPKFEFQAEVSGIPPKGAQCEEILVLKKGCQVIMKKNVEGEYYNGSSGIVTDIDKDGGIIYVKIVDSGKICMIPKNTWENVEYSVINGKLCEKTIGTITQFPMKLGYAITVHASQGMTFDHVIVDAEKSFANGQAYVALSRCRTLENTYLSSRVSNSQLIQDPVLIDFYDKCEANNGVFEPENLDDEDKEEAINFSDFGL